jgi:hypothetical protein
VASLAMSSGIGNGSVLSVGKNLVARNLSVREVSVFF